MMDSLTTSTAEPNLHPAANPLLLAYKDAGYIHHKVSNITDIETGLASCLRISLMLSYETEGAESIPYSLGVANSYG